MAFWQVYCDMETNGGGWTLVASVHESDINAKCFSDDLWSGYITAGQTLHGKSNWESERIFGSVRHCNKEDYKSSAYYKLSASDLMVWHVPAGLHLDTMRRNAILRYRTTNKFLQRYSGNLKALFDNHFPLSVDMDGSPATAALNAISTKFSEIKKAIPNFYDYTVTESSYYINDNTMYGSISNYIYVRSNQWSSSRLYYGRLYREPKTYSSVISSVTTPFTVIFHIRNDDRLASLYEVEVDSIRASEPSTIGEFENTMTLGNFKLHYHAYEHYQPRKLLKTECRFHFYISNKKEWKSVEPTRFYKSYEYKSSSSSNSNRDVRYRIIGNPSRILFGYMLLSRDVGMRFTSTYLNRVAQLILQSMSGRGNVIMQAPSTNKTLVVPITFDKGSITEVVNRIPPEMRPSIHAGNIQFRAYNFSGYPNAFCPGISVDHISPEYVCVGGVSQDVTPHGTCGDFAGWRGKATDLISPSRPVGYSHSSKDILSTLLFFYR